MPSPWVLGEATGMDSADSIVREAALFKEQPQEDAQDVAA